MALIFFIGVIIVFTIRRSTKPWWMLDVEDADRHPSTRTHNI